MIDNSEELLSAIVELLRATRREFRVFVPKFDPRIWNSAIIVNGLRTLLVSSPQASAKFCLQDYQSVREQVPMLLALCDRLPSRCEIRHAGDEHRSVPESFLLFDRYQYLRRATPIERTWSSSDRLPSEADRLGKLFVTLWESAAPHPDLRRLSF